MPKSETPLGEKPPFDVYAMFTILTFLATLGATLIINKDLTENWKAGLEPMPKVAEGVTAHNSQTEADTGPGNQKVSKEPEVTPEDLADYEILAKQGVATQDKPKNYKPYPGWLNPKKNPISTMPGKDNTEGVPENVRKDLADKYVETDPLKGPEEGGGAAAPEKAPEAPKAP